MKLSNLYNPLMKWLLRSPLHFVVSSMYMIVTFTGRKSGKTYSTPVEYFNDGGDILFMTTRSRLWWRNLRDGAAVTLRVAGKDVRGTSQTVTGDPAVYANALDLYVQKFPKRKNMLPRMLGMRLEADGSFNAEDISRVAGETVIVRITPG